MRVTILGCGPSNGVPTVTGDWGKCDPKDPKNRRLRPSILIETQGKCILIDTSPDFRAQALAANIQKVDALLYTHEHADHIMGIDDLRSIHRQMGKQIEVFASKYTLNQIVKKFSYLFDTKAEIDPDLLYRPIFRPTEIKGEFKVGKSLIVPVEQDHGICSTLGFRIGDFAYSTDVVRLPKSSKALLKNLDCWIVDCLRPSGPHPTHAHWDITREWIEELKPKRTVLTHMNFETDYESFRALLPSSVVPGYDGMEIVL
jgi:phosphoribosyl 1,2-cyclic phosphate phosphodiesterase